MVVKPLIILGHPLKYNPNFSFNSLGVDPGPCTTLFGARIRQGRIQIPSTNAFERYAKICSSKLLKIAKEESSLDEARFRLLFEYSNMLGTLSNRAVVLKMSIPSLSHTLESLYADKSVSSGTLLQATNNLDAALNSNQQCRLVSDNLRQAYEDASSIISQRGAIVLQK